MRFKDQSRLLIRSQIDELILDVRLDWWGADVWDLKGQTSPSSRN
jgi:hypothetical protein